MLSRILGITFIIGLTVTIFNNCGEVQFTEAKPSGSSVASNSTSGVDVDESQPNQTDSELIDSLPTEERDIFRPISDLEEDPNLYEVYSCTTSEGVLVCHFPENVESAHTLCVGVNAVQSHQRHEAEISETGELLTLSDYLGPCKH